MDIQDIIKSQLTDQVLGQLGKQFGINDQNQSKQAAEGVINSMLAGLGRNASTPEGAAALNSALERDHDGSILDDLVGNIMGGQKAGSKTMDGAGILKHILGNKESAVLGGLSKEMNVDSKSLLGMATSLAPMLMGALGKTKKQNNMGAGDLGGLLSSVLTSQKSGGGNAQLGMIESLLDSDGDGKIDGDVINKGINILGSLFKK